jgi:soluble lytic murein transglycosylase-like protein
MQLMPATASRMGVRNAFDPEENISGGTKYMRLLLDTFSYAEKDQLILSLAAYNAGENLVQKLGRVPAIRETSEYVSSILGRYGQKIMSETPAQPPRITGPSTFDYG